MLESAEGEKIGESKIAARQGIAMVVLSRVGMATPGMVSTLKGASWPSLVISSQVMIPIIMNKLESQGFFKRYPKSPAPLQVTVAFHRTSFLIFVVIDRSPWPCVDFCHTHVLCHLRAEGLHQANGSWTAPAREDQEHEEPSRVALLQQGLVDLEQIRASRGFVVSLSSYPLSFWASTTHLGMTRVYGRAQTQHKSPVYQDFRETLRNAILFLRHVPVPY